jgi:hypothetical protein
LRFLFAVAAAVATSGCSFDSAGPGADDGARVRITSALTTENPHNALSAVVKFKTLNADSVRLIYRAIAPDPRIDPQPDRVTPFFAVQGDSGRIAALGLRENTSYNVVLEVRGGNADTAATMVVRAASLPSTLAGLRLDPTGNAPPGYTLTDFTTAGAAYIVAFDETGRLAWYREFAAQPGEVAIDAEQQANGDYILFVGVSTGWQPTPGRFYEVDPIGDSVQTYVASAPYYTDPHELLLEYNGDDLSHLHILGYEFRHLDLTAIGGRQDQLVAGHVILRQSPSGSIEYLWNAWDHFTIADWIFIQPGLAQMPSIDFDHPNSLTKDTDGNYVVSFASLGEITKIDASTGQMIWRLGGRNNQFTFIGDPLGGFGIQHHVRVLPNGNILLIDNGVKHNPPESRAVEYKLDLVAHTATLVWQYRHSPALFAPFAGSAQRLKNGNTFVAFGAASRVAEVTPAGQVVWEAQMTNSGSKVPFFYRARRLSSLYRFEER